MIKLELNKEEGIIEQGDEWYWEKDEFYRTGPYSLYAFGNPSTTVELVGPLFNPNAFLKKTPEEIIAEALS